MSITQTNNSTGPFLVTAYPSPLPTPPFQFATDLVVYDLGQTGGSAGPMVMTLGSDYTVSGGGYNSQNDMLSGAVLMNAGGAGDPQPNDNFLVVRMPPPTQLIQFLQTGPFTAAMTEQMGDKLTTLIQELLAGFVSPFPAAGGGPFVYAMPWITADSGGDRTALDSVDVTAITTGLPLFVKISIPYPSPMVGNDDESWTLRAMSGGDPAVTTLPTYVVPITNPNSLIWARTG